MNDGNNNLTLDYRYLTKNDFRDGCRTFLAAFADYFVPLQMTEPQFANHLAQNAVKLEKSVGAFVDGKMIGLTLNGFGDWHGVPTVYDAGTGIIPKFRNAGAGKGMFEFMMSDFKNEGFQQVLLEVISHNEKAIHLYRKLGFETTRELIYYECKSVFPESENEFDFREIALPDWISLKKIAAGQSSWQNSCESFDRNSTKKILVGAFDRENCVGYGTAYCNSGIVTQIAVAEDYRRKKIGTGILSELQKCVGEDKFLKVSNVDENLQTVAEFLGKHGFSEKLRQYEMLKIL